MTIENDQKKKEEKGNFESQLVSFLMTMTKALYIWIIFPFQFCMFASLLPAHFSTFIKIIWSFSFLDSFFPFLSHVSSLLKFTQSNLNSKNEISINSPLKLRIFFALGWSDIYETHFGKFYQLFFDFYRYSTGWVGKKGEDFQVVKRARSWEIW